MNNSLQAMMAGLVTVCSAGSAFATTVPASYAVTSASTLLQVNSFPKDTTVYGTSDDKTATPGTVSATTATQFSSGDGTVVFSKGPALTAHGFAGAAMAPSPSPSEPTVSGANRGEGDAKAIYWMAIEGPASAATVPIRVIANGIFSVTGGRYTSDGHGSGSFAYSSGSLTAQWYDGTGFINGAVHSPVESPNQPLVDEEASVRYTVDDRGKKTSSIDLNRVYDFTNESLYQITMSITAGSEIVYDTRSSISNDGNLYADAFLDPIFQIDPAYAKLGYRLSFSEGINNGLVSTVPLPSSAPMFGAALLGVAGVGYAAKRKKAWLKA